MNSLFAGLALTDIHQDVARNIVSLCQSQDLFDDLTDNPSLWSLAQQVEDDVKPVTYRSRTPIIHRPFEDADWFNAIAWPFQYWQSSRFSDGTYGVWYGSKSVETTVYESAYHWYRGLLSDAGFEQMTVTAERKVYSIKCDAALLNLQDVHQQHPDLVHPSDYSFCQSVGARVHREGHPGMLTQSVRHPKGQNLAIFNPNVLSNPRHHGQLTYRLDAEQITVEKQPGVVWFTLDAGRF